MFSKVLSTLLLVLLANTGLSLPEDCLRSFDVFSPMLDLKTVRGAKLNLATERHLAHEVLPRLARTIRADRRTNSLFFASSEDAFASLSRLTAPNGSDLILASTSHHLDSLLRNSIRETLKADSSNKEARSGWDKEEYQALTLIKSHPRLLGI